MMKYYRCITLVVIAVLMAATAHAQAWKVCRSQWTEQDEKVYSDFVERICDSKYGNLNKFIKDPKVNPLYGEEDKKFNLSPDCADLPYMIRAYVAYKLRLPFSYVSEISGNGGDERYSQGNKAKQFKDQDYFKSPQQLFYQVALVNSGYFRMSATSENSDHYPIKISKKNLTPGTIYYDPDGHVALVAKVYDNGRIRLIDAHPDKSISKPWFGTKFSKGNKNNGGGFKKWRQIRYTDEGKIVRTQNHNLKDYSATDQYAKSFSVKGKSGLGYHEYIRLSVASTGARSDPMTEFCYMMQDIYEDIRYRAMAVDVAIQKGCHLKPHPGKLPYNIYGTDGIWEELSTPSRDARLKVAFREFYDTTRQMVLAYEQQDRQMARALAYNFLLKYDELAPKFCITYRNSAGKNVTLNFADVNYRLFDLSFDPYHSIEYRWGARGSELASASDGETKKNFYYQEKRLRNSLERVYGCHTPITMGPDQHVSVDIRGWLYNYIQGNNVDRQIIAFNRETIANQPQVAAVEEETEEVAVIAKADEKEASEEVAVMAVADENEETEDVTSVEEADSDEQEMLAMVPATKEAVASKPEQEPEKVAEIAAVPTTESADSVYQEQTSNKITLAETSGELDQAETGTDSSPNPQSPTPNLTTELASKPDEAEGTPAPAPEIATVVPPDEPNDDPYPDEIEDFFGALLTQGDQLAAAIVDTNRYEP